MKTQYYYISERIFPQAPMTRAWITGIRKQAAIETNCDAIITYHVSHPSDTTQLRIVLDYPTQTPESSLNRHHRFLQVAATFLNAYLPDKSLNLMREGAIFGTTHLMGSTVVLDLALDYYDNALFSADGNCYGEAKTVVVKLNELHKETQLAWQSIIDNYVT